MARATADRGTTEGRGTTAESGNYPPGPDGLPVVGNTVEFFRRGPFAFYDVLAEYGDVVSYSVAGRNFVTVLHPDYVERVLVTDADRFRRYNFESIGVEFAPEGLLLTEGEQWRRQRTAIQPAFRPDRIATYADAMTRYAAESADSWGDGEEIAINEELSKLTLRVLAKSLFDLDIEGRDDAVTRAAAALQDRSDSRSIQAFFPSWVPTPANRRYNQAMDDFRELVDELIAERRATEETYDDLLALLLDGVEGVENGPAGISGDGPAAPDGDHHLPPDDATDATMSDEEIRDQMITFLFAGHETTSLALTYTFLLLSQHDDVRERLREEHRDVLGDDDPAVADLSELSYTEQVIDESLRLYPPAYIMFRKATADVEIGGYRVPEGTKLTVPQFRLHKDERFYDDPETFRPERWTDEFEERLPEYAYFPFGGGPRHCIGMRFAVMELKLALPTILRRVDFELLSDPDPDFRASTTLRPVEDVRMRVRERKNG